MEGLLFVGAAVFYLLRAAFRGTRWLINRYKKNKIKPRPLEQANRSVPSEPVLPPRSAPLRQTPVREAVAAERPTRERAPAPPPPPAEEPLLRPDGQDLVRGLIWQEILAPPLSQRQKRPFR